MNKIEIEKKASDTLANISYDDTNEAVDVVEVAKKLGFAVGSAGLDEGMDGFIIIQEGQKEILGIKTDKLIGVNAANDLTWKRFTVAHEIGHYMLHYNREQDHGMYAHREHAKGKDETENEADYARQAQLAAPQTLMVNSLSENPRSYGGAFYFAGGQVRRKLGYGIAGMMTIEV